MNTLQDIASGFPDKGATYNEALLATHVIYQKELIEIMEEHQDFIQKQLDDLRGQYLDLLKAHNALCKGIRIAAYKY